MIMCLKSWGTIIEEDKEDEKKEVNKDISLEETSFIY